MGFFNWLSSKKTHSKSARDPVLQSYLNTVKDHLTCGGKLSLLKSFTPNNRNDPPPPTEKLSNTAMAPNVYLLFAVQMDLRGLDHHDAELLARAWVNATIGDACEAFKGTRAARGHDFAYELTGVSDHALRLRTAAVANPRWRVKWNRNWWDPVQAIATDHLPHPYETTREEVATQVWVAVGTPVVEIARFTTDPTGNTLYDYASSMEAIRLGYEVILARVTATA